MSSKQVDGINKIDKADLEKSRKAVLDTINEVEEKEKAKKPKKQEKKVDGLIFKKKDVKTETSPDLLSKAYKIQEAERLKPKPIKKTETKPATFEQVEAVKRIISDTREEKTLAKKTPKEVSKKIEKAEEKKAEKRRDAKLRQAARLEKDKKKATREKLDEQKKQIREKEKKQEREKTRKKFLDYKKKTSVSLKLLKNNLKLYFVILLRITLYSLIWLILLYIIYAILLLKFSYDNNTTRKIAAYVTVPAVVTKTNIIEYYKFKDIQSKLREEFTEDQAYLIMFRYEIAKLLIVEKLAKRFDLVENNYNDSELEEKILNDSIINQVAFKRINKIKSLIEEGENFIEVSTKFGDEQGKFDFSLQAEVDSRFGQAVSNLTIGAISDVVTSEKGYYILRRENKGDGIFAYSYVFIKAQTLNDYIITETNNIKMWSFVDF